MGSRATSDGETRRPPSGSRPASRRRIAVRGRLLACGGAVLVAVSAVAGSTTARAVGGAPSAAPGTGSLVRVGVVSVRDLPSTPSPGHPGLRKPFLSPRLQTPASTAPARHVPVVDTGGSATGTSSATVSAGSVSTATPSVLGGFPVWSSAQSQSTFSQSLTPPDTQLAAGPNSLLEMVNDVGSVWPKTGGAPTKTFDLAAFFKVPAGQTFSDPRVIYDSPTGTWFATGLSFTSSYGSQIYIAVSQTSDPAGAWWLYNGDASSNVLHDQPKIGVSADKVVMAWNDFLSASFFEGSVMWVIQKSALSGGNPAISAYGPDSARPSIAPAQNLAYAGTDTTVYAVYNNSPSVGLLAITGTPGVNVSLQETDPSMGATAAPPAGDQPGASGSIDTNDTRFLGATWQAGTLWTSADDGCGSPAVACGRLVGVSTAGSTSVVFSTDLTYSGGSLYYPAVTTDSAGDMVAVYTASSSSVYPSVRAIAATAPSYALQSPTTLQSGLGLYGYGSCLTSGPCRWGDYEGAAVDPSNPANVWMTGQYAAAATVGNNWGTYTSEMTLAGGGTTSDFSMSASPTTVSVVQGSGGTSTISTAVTSGSAQTVNLSASGLPAGATASFNPASVTAGGSSTLTLTAASTTPTGSSTITVTGTGTSATHTTTVTLTVTAATASDFSISASPSSISIHRGHQAGVTILTTVISGSAQSVALTVSGLPAGVTVTFSPDPVTAGASSIMTITVSSSARVGNYTLTVTGTATSATHSTSVALHVRS